MLGLCNPSSGSHEVMWSIMKWLWLFLVGLGQHTKHWHTFRIRTSLLLLHRQKRTISWVKLYYGNLTVLTAVSEMTANFSLTYVHMFTGKLVWQTAYFLTLAYRALLCSHLVLLMCKVIPVVQKLTCCLKWMVKKKCKWQIHVGVCMGLSKIKCIWRLFWLMCVI